jgi:hypothetical protein
MTPRLCPSCRKRMIRTKAGKVCRGCRVKKYRARQDEIIRNVMARRKIGAEPVPQV